MTWTFASFVILALALAAGFAWWERSRPPSRMLALVATLAALAALGRIAFAPIPNVKPTTDIVLFAGFALGAAPGFVVGATAALASNLFFGQGPWTPWQMAAWGLVGVLGAGLARVMPDPRRIPLALACGFAGLLYGALLNTSLWVQFSDHSLRAWLTYAGSGVPFDLAHMIGNIVFSLAFGLAFIGSLQRFRARMSVRWVPVIAAAMLLLAAAPMAIAAPPRDYLAGAQNADGGFGAAPGQSSTGLYTGWAALGLEAAGRHPADVRRRGGKSLLQYLRATAGSLNDIGELERTILVLEAAGIDSRAFAGRDLVAALLDDQRRNGAFAGRVNHTAFGILALEASGTRQGVRRAVRWLARQANDDGGFNFGGKGGPSGVDDTSAPLQALVAAGKGRSRIVRRAARFLARAANEDDGHPLSPGGDSNAQSTAWAVQGLAAAGRSVRGGLRYLRSLTRGNGLVRYSRTNEQTPVWVTAQALTAFAKQPFPLGRVARERRPRRAAPEPRPTATPEPDKTARPDRAPAAGRSVSDRTWRPYVRRAGSLLGLALAVV